MNGWIWPARRYGNVDLLTARTSQHVVQIESIDAAARKNLDAPDSLLDQLANQRRAVIGVVLLAAGQNTSDTEIDELLQRHLRIGHDVERPMKHRLLVAGQLDQTTVAAKINFSGFGQNAKDNPIGTQLQR